MNQVGKRIGEDLYVHLSAVVRLPDEEHRRRIAEELTLLPPEGGRAVNVAKINVRSGRISLLEYPQFDEQPFPALARSWSRRASGGSEIVCRSYQDSFNPPVLHRKELLVHPDHPSRARWAELTMIAEGLGLFDNGPSIGFRLNWERAIAEKGYRLDGESFLPLGNVVEDILSADGDAKGVQRHLTALARCAISAPVQLLLRHDLLRKDKTFFDYGCGRGDDVAALTYEGFTARGWDPHYAAANTAVRSDVVNVGFVINVIEDPAERVEVLHKAFQLTAGVMALSVMLYGPTNPGKPFRDGFVTTRGTFQKYFGQAELKDYLEHALHAEAFLVGPGVAFVFADKDLEQRFLVRRYRRSDVSARLLGAWARPAPIKPKRERDPAVTPRVAEPDPLLERLWKRALDLGRYPEDSELEELPALIEAHGSLGRALRRMQKSYDQALLERAQVARTDDLRLYFAVMQFSKRPRYRELEAGLQRDVKAFFSDYANAQAAGLRLLGQAADPAVILAACQEASEKGLGWLDRDHSLQIHVSLVDRLPPVLRAFVSCGLVVYGDLGKVDLVKIHVESGKLTLLEFDDFAQSPTPLLSRRVKVNVRCVDYDVFEYGDQFPKHPLYWKSRYLNEESEGYADQLAFDEALDATGLLGESEFGPSCASLAGGLSARRLEICGMRLQRSTSIPRLDERCGAHFTYRDFIECGETQAGLSLPNVPTQAQTFNALYDLATKLLDPIIDYFGMVRLTYGFCSAELAAHIKARIAPELDQHAAHELNKRCAPMCSRGGAACDFLIEDESMREVADWIIENLPFDRLYFYGEDRPLHLSYSSSESSEAYSMLPGPSGRLVPRKYARSTK